MGDEETDKVIASINDAIGVENVADGDEIPESEEEITQDPTPINPEEEGEE